MALMIDAFHFLALFYLNFIFFKSFQYFLILGLIFFFYEFVSNLL